MAKTVKNRKCTEHLSVESRELFERCAEEFGIEDFAHQKILLTACEANDRMRAAQKVIRAEGVTMRDRHGVVRPHAATHVEEKSRNAMFKAFALLKLDPPDFEDEDDSNEN